MPIPNGVVRCHCARRDARLRELRARVADELIPQLEAEGERLSAESLEEYDDARLADALEHRVGVLTKWKKIYWDVFIPFAHGVRRLATYYNDFVQPGDPYEFVGLLQKQPLMAAERNDAIERLAARVAGNEPLRRGLQAAADRIGRGSSRSSLRHELADVPGGEEFLSEFEELSRRFLDITYERTRLGEAPEPVLRNILELSRDDRDTASFERAADERRGAREAAACPPSATSAGRKPSRWSPSVA